MSTPPTRAEARLFARTPIAAILFALGASNPFAVHAQQASTGADPVVLDAINVTAEHRTEDLQKTPVAISVINERTINNQQIKTVREAVSYTPNLVAPTTNQPSTQTFYLRGIGEPDPFQESAIAVYSDDVLLPRPLNSNLYFDDVERIEVLRGPQGTLYGRNSSAGAVRIISHEPNGTAEGSASIGLGNYNAKETRAHLSGSLGNDLYGSLSFVNLERDGAVWNDTLKKKVGNLNLTAVRAKLRYKPNDDLDVLFSLWGSTDKSDTSPLIPGVPPYGNKFDPYKTYGASDPHDEVRTGTGSLRVAYQINPDLQFKSITAYAALNQDGVYDNGGLPWLVSSDPANTKQKYGTQEFQLNGSHERWNYTTGLFYYNEDFIANRNSNKGGASPYYFGQRSDTNTTSTALYGQTNYKFTDRLSGTLGLRWTHEKKDFNYQVYNLTAYVPGGTQNIVSTRVNVHPDASWSATTPKIGVEYQWSPTLDQYASIAKGFKAGGFDHRASSKIAALTPFQPETVVTYETGLKGEFLDKRLRTNVAVFYNDYKDYQASAWDPTLGVVIKQNAKKAHVSGIEFEGALAATSRLQLFANLGLLDAKFDDFKNAVGTTDAGTTYIGSVNGKRIPYAPKLSANIGFDYQIPTNLPGVVKVGSTVNYRDAFYSDYVNTQIAKIPSQTLINLSSNYLTSDGKWKFTAAIKNVADRAFRNAATYSPSIGRLNYIYSDPRTFQVSAQYNFF